MNIQILILAFIGGMLPALFWLWFWLKEDSLHPEPRKYIAISFIAGIISALLSIPTEAIFYDKSLGILTLIILASIEELFKYSAAYFSALRKDFVDEPIDVLVYMITVALGFSAIENVIFLANSLSNNTAINSIVVGNMRFIGATLLHTVTSGVIGIFIALAFFKGRLYKKIYLVVGIITAISLHTFFNSSIINIKDGDIFSIFGFVWLGVIVLILFFEKIKRLNIN